MCKKRGRTVSTAKKIWCVRVCGLTWSECLWFQVQDSTPVFLILTLWLLWWHREWTHGSLVHVCEGYCCLVWGQFYIMVCSRPSYGQQCYMRIVWVTTTDWIHGKVGVWTGWKRKSDLSADVSPVMGAACVECKYCKPETQQDGNKDNDSVWVCVSNQRQQCSLSEGGYRAQCYRPKGHISFDSVLSPKRPLPVVSRGSGLRQQFEIQELSVRTPVDEQCARWWSNMLQECEWQSKFVLHGLLPRMPMYCLIHIFCEWLKTMSHHWEALIVGRCLASFCHCSLQFPL